MPASKHIILPAVLCALAGGNAFAQIPLPRFIPCADKEEVLDTLRDVYGEVEVWTGRVADNEISLYMAIDGSWTLIRPHSTMPGNLCTVMAGEEGMLIPHEMPEKPEKPEPVQGTGPMLGA